MSDSLYCIAFMHVLHHERTVMLLLLLLLGWLYHRCAPFQFLQTT